MPCRRISATMSSGPRPSERSVYCAQALVLPLSGRGRGLALGQLILEGIEFAEQHCDLKGVETAFHVDPEMLVSAVLSMTRDLAQAVCQGVFIGEQRTASATTAPGFDREEGGGRDCGQREGAVATVGPARALRCVLDQGYPKIERGQRLEIGVCW